MTWRLLSEPVAAFEFDFNKPLSAGAVRDLGLVASTNGRWDAIAVWHRVQLDAKRNMSTGPDCPYALQGVLALPEAEEVRAGDKLTCSASHSETSFAFEFATKPIMEWEDEDDAGDEENGKKSLAQGARQISRWHWAMLMDRTRNDPYAEAIAKAARKATTVLDIGSGTGLLSMFAARAGAKEIYTVEGTEAMAKMAQRCIKKNGFEKQIKGYCMMSTEMEVGRELPRRCDLCISEIVDVGLLGEHALPSMAHARDHLLTPDAVAIPCGAMVHAFLFELPRQAYSLSRPLDTEGGVNLTPFNTFAYDKDS